MVSTHYDPRWPHVVRRHAPDEAERLEFYRFVRREYVWPDGWTCYIRDIRYNPRDRIAVVFEYAAAECQEVIDVYAAA